jgi:hypothetical protein
VGYNHSHTPLLWRQWDEDRFDTQVIKFLREWLETCFSESRQITGCCIILTILSIVKEEQEQAALRPVNLDDAKYTVDANHESDDGGDTDSGDDSDSGSSESESDSDHNSDLPSSSEDEGSNANFRRKSSTKVKK